MKATSAVVALTMCLCAPARGQGVATGDGVTLAQAVDIALALEPAARAARADVEAARGMSLQASLRANPTVSLEWREEPGGTDRATDIGIEWPLELFRRDARVAVAGGELRVAEHEEADVRRHLAGEVARAYGEVAAAYRGLEITDEVLAAANNQLESLRARATQGAAPTLDRDVADVEVRRIQADRLAASGRSERALLRLKRLMGLSPEMPLRLAQSLEELTAPIVSDTVPSARPDVLAAEARVRTEDSRVAAARSEARPDVTLFGSYMRMDAGFPQQGFTGGGTLERVRSRFNYLGAGAMVSLPLWNRQQGAVAAAAASRQGAVDRLEATRLTAAADVAEARVWYDQARAAVVLYAEGVRPLARRNLETIRETYRLGRATIFDVLAEQRRFLETERAYTEALSDAYASRVGLLRALGELP